jgi:predicted site-specific integrase-resolvase
MMTVTEFAEKKGISAATVYSWIYRNQAERNGFKVLQVGKVKLIEELKKKK